MRISDWSSDVCSSDLGDTEAAIGELLFAGARQDDQLAVELDRAGPLRKVEEGRERHFGQYHGAAPLPAAQRLNVGIAHRLGLDDCRGDVLQDRKSTRLNSVTNAHLVCRLLLEKKK